MAALEELANLCKAEVSVSINPHTSTYETIHGWLNGADATEDEVSKDLLFEMGRRGKLVWVQAYPSTPIGFYRAFHWDLETAINLVLAAVKSDR